MGWPWKKKPRFSELKRQPLLGDGIGTDLMAEYAIPGYLDAQLQWERFMRDLQADAEQAERVKRRRAIRRQIHRAAVWQA